VPGGGPQFTAREVEEVEPLEHRSQSYARLQSVW
jgi:hypothetical protein